MSDSMKHIISFLFVVFFCAYACNRINGPFPVYSVHGIDVSHYQNQIDWQKVAAHGVDFGFVKATEGTSLRDSFFCANWSEMGKVGIRRGAYHFFRPSYSAHEQADHFINLVEMKAGDLAPVLDVEVLDGVSRVDLLKGMYIWLFRIEIAYGIKPIIYTNQKFYNRYLSGHFEDYPIWIARYNVWPPRIKGGARWSFWQYGDRGQIPGIHGHVDVNVFRGTKAELDKFTLPAQSVLNYTAVEEKLLPLY